MPSRADQLRASLQHPGTLGALVDAAGRWQVLSPDYCTITAAAACCCTHDDPMNRKLCPARPCLAQLDLVVQRYLSGPTLRCSCLAHSAFFQFQIGILSEPLLSSAFCTCPPAALTSSRSIQYCLLFSFKLSGHC